jgi:hypothetical protein
LHYPRNDDYSSGGTAAETLPPDRFVSPRVNTLTGNALLALARINVKDGLYEMFAKPWNAEHFKQPFLADVPYPRAYVSRAVYDERAQEGAGGDDKTGAWRRCNTNDVLDRQSAGGRIVRHLDQQRPGREGRRWQRRRVRQYDDGVVDVRRTAAGRDGVRQADRRHRPALALIAPKQFNPTGRTQEGDAPANGHGQRVR